VAIPLNQRVTTLTLAVYPRLSPP